MTEDGRKARKIWIASGAVAVLAMGLVLALFRRPSGETPGVPPKGRVAVDLTRLEGGKTGALEQQAVLGDPTPLFLPTDWNFGQGVLPQTVVREPGQSFRLFSAKLMFGDADLVLRLPTGVKVPESAGEALVKMTDWQLTGLGSADRQPMELTARPAYIEVRSAESGEKVLETPLADAQPPGDRLWQPAEFLIAVDAAGLVGPPVQTVRSGIDEVDRYLQAYVANGLQIGARLNPGLYRVSVGP